MKSSIHYNETFLINVKGNGRFSSFTQILTFYLKLNYQTIEKRLLNYKNKIYTKSLESFENNVP